MHRLVLVLGPDPVQPLDRGHLAAALGRDYLAVALGLDLGRPPEAPVVVVMVGLAAVGQAVVVALQVVVVSRVGSVALALAAAVAWQVVVIGVVAALLVVQLQVVLPVPSNSVGVSALGLFQRLTLGYHCPLNCVRRVLVLQRVQVVAEGLYASIEHSVGAAQLSSTARQSHRG